MKGRIATDSLTHQFRLLRNRIESEVHASAVILVTSATPRDGTAVTAYGLAESLSKTHQRTALITTALPPLAEVEGMASVRPAQRRRASDALSTEGQAAGTLSIVTISHERLATISRSSVASLVEDLRAKHDYVVVDGGDLPANGFAMLLVASADATLITFLAGRQQAQGDRVMLDTLERVEAKVLGVVMTDQASIDHFGQREVASEIPSMSISKAPKRQQNPFVNGLGAAIQRLGKTL